MPGVPPRPASGQSRPATVSITRQVCPSRACALASAAASATSLPLPPSISAAKAPKCRSMSARCPRECRSSSADVVALREGPARRFLRPASGRLGSIRSGLTLAGSIVAHVDPVPCIRERLCRWNPRKRESTGTLGTSASVSNRYLLAFPPNSFYPTTGAAPRKQSSSAWMQARAGRSKYTPRLIPANGSIPRRYR